jgi:hypothetical protein
VVADRIFTSVSPARQAEYKRIYDRLMERARGRVKEKGVHDNHHIVPKSLGGSNEKSNIAVLTYDEHFLAHWLLAKFTTGEARISMLKALSEMKRAGKNNRNRRVSRWQYAIARRAQAEAQSLWNKSPKGKEALKKGGATRRAFYSTPEGQEVAKETGKKIGPALTAFYTTPEGQEAAKKIGATLTAFYETTEGQAAAKERGEKTGRALSAFYETPEGQKVAKERGKKVGATLKARGSRAGENHPNAKVTEDLVLKIRAFPGTRSEAAKHFGVSYDIASGIMCGRTWKHLESVI